MSLWTMSSYEFYCMSCFAAEFREAWGDPEAHEPNSPKGCAELWGLQSQSAPCLQDQAQVLAWFAVWYQGKNIDISVYIFWNYLFILFVYTFHSENRAHVLNLAWVGTEQFDARLIMWGLLGATWLSLLPQWIPSVILELFLTGSFEAKNVLS